MAADDDMVSRQDYETLKKSQAGSDAQVTKLQKIVEKMDTDNKELKAQLEVKDGEKVNKREELEKYHNDRSEQFNRQMDILTSAIAKGIDPQRALETIGLTGKTDEERLQAIADGDKQIEVAFADKYARTKGRTVHKSRGMAQLKTTLDDYTDKEIRDMPGGQFERVQEASKPVKQGTVRDWIRGLGK